MGFGRGLPGPGRLQSYSPPFQSPGKIWGSCHAPQPEILIQLESKPVPSHLLTCFSLRFQMALSFYQSLCIRGIFVTGIRLLIAGACKERCGQTKSDLETEARIRLFESILEGLGRCQGSDQGWSVPARNRGAVGSYLGNGSLADPELGKVTGKQTLAVEFRSSLSIT